MTILGVEYAVHISPPTSQVSTPLADDYSAIIEAAMPNIRDLSDPEFGPIKARLVRAYLEHKGDLGAMLTDDSEIIALVDEITALLLAAWLPLLDGRIALRHYGTGRWPLCVGSKGEKFMALGTGRCTRLGVRVIAQATAYSVMVLAALVLFGTAGVPSPAIAQVTTKSKLKPPVKADPTDSVANQLNAKWLQENGAYTGFKKAEPAVVPASYSTPAVANDWGDRLVSRAMKHLGAPYRHGGTSPSTGFDCSGFVYYLYGAVFGQSIPRMPHDMAREGRPVARSDLKRGDLVFFGYRGTFTHIGIYVGNDQFVHATRPGSPVQVTALDADYYRDRYMTAVRLSPR